MTSMSEKGVFLSRSISCIIAVSILFLILSSSLLLQFGDTSLVPRSIYKRIIINTTSNHIKSKPIEPKLNPIKPLGSCDPTQAKLKVFMYDLPVEFHFGLLGWKQNRNQIWPNVSNLSLIPSYPGGLNLQHSIEYWLTLDLLASVNPNVVTPCTAILVKNSTQSDVIFVPFFSSLSYNRHSKIRGVERGQKTSLDKILQEKLVKYLKGRPEWKRFGGKDHLIMAHHPNSMLLARKHLGSAIFVLADFGRYDVKIANVKKDVIAPYKHVVRSVRASDSPLFEERPVLVYFQGAIYRKDGGTIRQKLYYLMKDEKDVHFTFGSVAAGGVRKAARGMSSSKFCLHIAGDTPSSNRLFDAIASHCVPVIISDDIELPFEDVLDYSKFSVFVRSSDAVKTGYLLGFLRGIRREKWVEMWENLKQVGPCFEYRYPSERGDAVNMMWQAVYRKICSSVDFKVQKKNRFQMSQNFLNDHKKI